MQGGEGLFVNSEVQANVAEMLHVEICGVLKLVMSDLLRTMQSESGVTSRVVEI